MTDHFVFAYGSLIDEHSRQASNPPITPLSSEPLRWVRICGYRQGWLTPCSGFTYLGVIPDGNARSSGVLLHVDEEVLKRIDGREDEGKVYKRVPVNPSAIQLIGSVHRFESPVWLYKAIRPGAPSEEFPIWQSYVDVVLRGCIREFKESFAKEVVGSCCNWARPWENDRKEPRYPRQGKGIQPAEEAMIDKVLSACEVLRHRRPAT